MPDELDRNVSFTAVCHTIPFAVHSSVSDGITFVRFKNSDTGEKFLSETYRPAVGHAQPPIQEGKKALSLEIKWLCLEAAYICPSSANITNEWI